MKLDLLRHYLDEPQSAGGLLESMRLTHSSLGHTNLRRMAEAGVTLDLLANIVTQFGQVAPLLADADMAWNNLERFLQATRSPMATAALFERDPQALPNLLQLLSTSQYLADMLVQDNECYDLLRMTEGQPVAREVLLGELLTETLGTTSQVDAMAALRRFKRRETIRIAYGDIVRGHNVATVARQLSFVAEAVIDAALQFARRGLEVRFGIPETKLGPAKFVVLGLGKLGGVELNYSSDIDLILIYEAEGQTDARRPISNQEFFERLSRELVRMLTEPTALGMAYRVDLRLRPEGSRGAVCLSLDRAIAYYDIKGRTWERQALIKSRPVGGDRDLGEQLLQQLEPWIYGRYLSLTDITGIKSLKRRIERRTRGVGADERNVKTGHGGIRDIEFVIQFLQLLNGGHLHEVRTGNTLEAIDRLGIAGCLTHQEQSLLTDNYNALRKLEHRLQIMYDLQTHMLPADRNELRKVAIRMGYSPTSDRSALEAFEADYLARTELNRKILDHLLHDAFDDDPVADPEVDLVNDPDPGSERIAAVLGKYPFNDVQAAYDHLMELATERIRFLSTRRCRHFLASIAPRLLPAIARTPDPDTTLVNLSNVSDSLGGKGALWELFSANRPSLDLYVTLCAACPYLAGILTSNPGMIDELMDSLLVERLPSHAMLTDTLHDLVRGAEDLDPILHSFKNAQHLRVGVRDILGRDGIHDTQTTLADIADVCLKQIADHEYQRLTDKYGEPTVARWDEHDEVDEAVRQRFGERGGDICQGVILALGKLGGREPNYHSDLDLVFLYEVEGSTLHRRRSRNPITTNAHFFGELGQRIIKSASQIGPFGRLYEVDARLRPTGKSGALAVPIDGLVRYFHEGRGGLWERQILCKARVVFGTAAAAKYAMQVVHQVAFGPAWSPDFAEQIRSMRSRLEESASPRNLKRCPGGTMDTEFLVQMCQLRYAGADASLREPGTLPAIAALARGGYLNAADAETLAHSYRFQRHVEARIRLMDAAGRHELPADRNELAKLAFLLGYSDVAKLERDAADSLLATRAVFDRLTQHMASGH